MQEFLLNLSKKQKIIIGVLLLTIVIIGFIFTYNYFYSKEEVTEIEETDITNEILEEQETSLIIGTSKNKVIVHVIGEVEKPGVVTLKEGERIIDAINAAGGQTEEADLSKINLAYIVEDGSQIYIPRIGEERKEIVTEDAGEGIIVESATLDDTEKKEAKVNINTATQEKLITLPGIGEATAQKIIDYRTQNGKFQSIEELKNVPGIGEAKYNNLSTLITT